MSEPLRIPSTGNILDDARSEITGNPVSVRDFKNIMLSVAGQNAFIIKVQGTVLDTETPPDFSSPATVNNRWDYVACFDYNNPSTVIVGTTGFTAPAGQYAKNLLLNVDGLTWACVTITKAVAGFITVDCVSVNNQ